MTIEYDRQGRRLCAKEACPAYRKRWCLSCLNYEGEMTDLQGEKIQYCKIHGKFALYETSGVKDESRMDND